MREAAMQLHLAFLELTDPMPPSLTAPTNAPSWEQIDGTARMAALELLARLIANMLAAQEATETPNE
jgi:hypothetical protein